MILRGDLHVHTSCSDGSMTPMEIISYASRIHLHTISITDHDDMRGFDAVSSEASDRKIHLIPGVEMSTLDDRTKRSVHLLVYYPIFMDELDAVFKKMAEKRKNASDEMIFRLKKHFPIDRDAVIGYAKDSSAIFRVHIMRALVEMGYDHRYYGTVYRQYLSQDEGRCYVPIQYTDMMEAALAARRSGGVTVLAHPSVYDSFDAAFRLAQAGLIDGVECFYPRRRIDMAEQYDRLLVEYGLIATGGTDFHGLYASKAQTLATCCTEKSSLQRITDLADALKKEHVKATPKGTS